MRAAQQNCHEKRLIAARAATYAEEGMVVGLSGGTTCTELARWLRGRRITVVTNAVNVATELYNHSHTKIVMTGGTLNSYSFELVGDSVVRTLGEIRLDLCFLGCSGITSEGAWMRDTLEASGARAFVEASRSTFLVADHSKVGNRTPAYLAPLPVFERLITDDQVSGEGLTALRRAGLTVETTHTPPPHA